MIKRELKFRVKESFLISVETCVFLLTTIVFAVAVVLIGIVGYAGLKTFAGMMGVC